MKQNSSASKIEFQSNVKSSNANSKFSLSSFNVAGSSINEEETFPSLSDNEAKPNLNLSPIANSQPGGGDSLSIGEESSDDGFFGRFDDSDIINSNHS